MCATLLGSWGQQVLAGRPVPSSQRINPHRAEQGNRTICGGTGSTVPCPQRPASLASHIPTAPAPGDPSSPLPTATQGAGGPSRPLPGRHLQSGAPRPQEEPAAGGKPLQLPWDLRLLTLQKQPSSASRGPTGCEPAGRRSFPCVSDKPKRAGSLSKPGWQVLCRAQRIPQAITSENLGW